MRMQYTCRFIVVTFAVMFFSRSAFAQQDLCKGTPDSNQVIGYGGCVFYGKSVIAGTFMEAATTITAGSGMTANGRIQNVQAGLAPTDAVNMGQLNQQYAYLDKQDANNRSVANIGVAIAMAAASVPALDSGKNFGIGVGTGTYGGRSALSVAGVARVSQSLQVKFNVGTGSDGRAAAGAGALMSW